MLKDVIIPSRVGSYFIFPKKVLSIDVTPFAVQAVLIHFVGSKAHIKSNKSVILKDFEKSTIIESIKQVVASFKSYDQVVTSLSSSSIVYKELTLPFVGREKLSMIVGYEVESLLPFALDQSVIDFMILQEDTSKSSSKIMVAAALKENVDEHYDLFKQAGVSLQVMSVDMFALYELYRHGIFQSKVEKTSALQSPLRKKLNAGIKTSQRFGQGQAELLVDFSFDITRVLYVQGGVLKAVRMIPYGVSDIADIISKSLGVAHYEVVQQLIVQHNEDLYEKEIKEGLGKLFKEISKTLSSFEKQVGNDYQKPYKIIMSGLGCHIYQFLQVAQGFIDIPVSEVSLTSIGQRIHMNFAGEVSLDVEYLVVLSMALFTKYNENINFLKHIATKSDTVLLVQQVTSIFILTVACIGMMFWHSSSVLQQWERAYISSKKELVQTIKKNMDLDLQKEKSLKTIVEKTDAMLKKEHQQWFAFSKQAEHSYLEYLQDLSEHIDKESIGLDLKKVSMTPEKVMLSGTLKSFESLEVFEEELAELQLLSLAQKPRELSFSNLELTIKDKDKHESV